MVAVTGYASDNLCQTYKAAYCDVDSFSRVYREHFCDILLVNIVDTVVD